VAATLTRSARSVTSATIGDYLVPYASALGRPQDGAPMFPGAETLHVPLADHFDLLNHHDVHLALQEWLLDRADPPTRQGSPQGALQGSLAAGDPPRTESAVGEHAGFPVEMS